MPSSPLILNEWVIHDLRGENQRQRQEQTFLFLKQVEKKCDHLILLRGSPWMKKAYGLMKESSSSPELRIISKFLHRTFILNSEKGKILHPEDLPPISSDLQAGVSSDDTYLVSLLTAVPEGTIVTNDTDLMETLSPHPNVKIHLRDDFLINYTV